MLNLEWQVDFLSLLNVFLHANHLNDHNIYGYFYHHPFKKNNIEYVHGYVQVLLNENVFFLFKLYFRHTVDLHIPFETNLHLKPLYFQAIYLEKPNSILVASEG